MAIEQRRQHRIGVALQLRISGWDAGGEAFQEMVQSEDLSRSGCSFLTAHDLPNGSELEIEIYRRAGAAPFLTRGRVMRVSVTAPAHRTVGVRFTGPQFPTYQSESTSVA